MRIKGLIKAGDITKSRAVAVQAAWQLFRGRISPMLLPTMVEAAPESDTVGIKSKVKRLKVVT